MDGEWVLWGILPLGAAVALAGASLYCLCRDTRGTQAAVGLPALLFLAAALRALAGSLAGGWPTFLPHIAVVLAVPLVAALVTLMRRRGSAGPIAAPDRGG